MKLYSFDVDGGALEQLPLAGRRALDHAGLRLPLAGWLSLPLLQRRALVSLGSQTVVDARAVAQCVAQAEPPAVCQPPSADPAAECPPADVVAAYGAVGPLSDRVWSSLADLDRYALRKVSMGRNSSRLAGAYAEIVGHTQVSTHVRAAGGVQMVNVGTKAVSRRRAEARSRVTMSRAAFELLASHAVPKGDVLSTARIAGIMAAKRTADLIPLCHALALTHVAVDLVLDADGAAVHIAASVETVGKTGVEMEALVAASTAALTIYDMLKGTDRAMQIGPTLLATKVGGASGDYSYETPV